MRDVGADAHFHAPSAGKRVGTVRKEKRDKRGLRRGTGTVPSAAGEENAEDRKGKSEQGVTRRRSGGEAPYAALFRIPQYRHAVVPAEVGQDLTGHPGVICQAAERRSL